MVRPPRTHTSLPTTGMSVADSDSDPAGLEDAQNQHLPGDSSDDRDVKGTAKSLPHEWEDEGEDPFEYDDYKYADVEPFEYDNSDDEDEEEDDTVSRISATPEPTLRPNANRTVTTTCQTR
ncbi:uncharacterized protein EHS24_007811 [Apiotrichum porosum]|uniref:Uncharacterized protein n=1 Tax=Apiotrichum porosum TaxID=105984 RepID=A0A427XS48_9TREE|nr:uncharacterized protein EHS24_007811 [Apiotrichum porosum]RSH81633.1 hypothetical protein EHS24_007811 [Apiotrichum porosum]